jgi:hypothetical protein
MSALRGGLVRPEGGRICSHFDGFQGQLRRKVRFEPQGVFGEMALLGLSQGHQSLTDLNAQEVLSWRCSAQFHAKVKLLAFIFA